MEKKVDVEGDSILSYCQEALKVLTGNVAVPENCPVSSKSDNRLISDRSIIDSENHRLLAVDYLEFLARALGYTNITRQKWTKTLRKVLDQPNIIVEYENLVVTIPGKECPDELVIVGAHYDVQNSFSRCWTGPEKGKTYAVTQGADDNG